MNFFYSIRKVTEPMNKVLVQEGSKTTVIRILIKGEVVYKKLILSD
jgi:hypothetical protein